MAITLDHRRNYTYWHNTETVKLTSTARRADEQTECMVSNAKKRPLTYKELATSQGAYTGTDRVWLLPQVLTTFPPKPGDKITDPAANVWTVLECPQIDLEALYRCTTRDLAIAYQLRDFCDLQVPTFTLDSSSVNVRTWTVKYPSLRCRVQPVQADQVDERGVRGARVTHTIFVEANIDPTDGHGNFGRIALADGTILEITGYHNPERIDELPVIDGYRAP